VRDHLRSRRRAFGERRNHADRGSLARTTATAFLIVAALSPGRPVRRADGSTGITGPTDSTTISGWAAIALCPAGDGDGDSIAHGRGSRGDGKQSQRAAVAGACSAPGLPTCASPTGRAAAEEALIGRRSWSRPTPICTAMVRMGNWGALRLSRQCDAGLHRRRVRRRRPGSFSPGGCARASRNRSGSTSMRGVRGQRQWLGAGRRMKRASGPFFRPAAWGTAVPLQHRVPFGPR